MIWCVCLCAIDRTNGRDGKRPTKKKTTKKKSKAIPEIPWRGQTAKQRLEEGGRNFIRGQAPCVPGSERRSHSPSLQILASSLAV